MKHALLLIDVQQGFLDSSFWGERNNPHFEKNVNLLLANYREKGRKIIHVQHVSLEPKSPLRPNQPGVDFMYCALPVKGETIFKKGVNSAFIGTRLEDYLKANAIDQLTVAGLTSDHCVSTTVRMASNFGFSVTIAHDATATFDREGVDGTKYKAQAVHEIALASLKGEFAQTQSTFELSF